MPNPWKQRSAKTNRTGVPPILLTALLLSSTVALPGCAKPSADPAEQSPAAQTAADEAQNPSLPDPQTADLRAGFDPARLLWYDGTSVGTPLNTANPKPIKSVLTSSTLFAGKRSYPDAHLTDNDPATAWCEGVGGSGSGESITVRFQNGHVPAAMRIVPGYAKSERTWWRNPRLLWLRVRFLPERGVRQAALDAGEEVPERVFVVALATAGKPARVPYARAQYIDFRPPFTQDMTAGDFDGIVLSILATEAVDPAHRKDGSPEDFEDTCISELRFYDW